MSRYIDADLLQEDFKEDHGGKRSLMIDTQPTADVRENVKAEWQACRLDGQEWYVSCSNCHVVMPPVNYNYCPNCGAQMRTADSEQYSILAEGGNE